MVLLTLSTGASRQVKEERTEPDTEKGGEQGQRTSRRGISEAEEEGCS